jgi:glycosyltransferase involved in cell wall biosynthesis
MQLSVVIPAYNREQLLPATLRSLLQQTLPADEIIVVDDGSTDKTAQLAESYGHPVRLVQQRNSGPAAARNRGFAESSGEFVHFFDSDDIACLNKHEIQIKTLEDTGADIAYGPWIKAGLSENRFTPNNQVFQQKGLPKGQLLQTLLCNWSVIPQTCLFRREVVERVGAFPEDLFGVEDQHFFMRCLLAGAKVEHSPHTLTMYRMDNAEKITANPQGLRLRVLEWARFQVLAAAECRAHGINPVCWLGFQRRAWLAWEELATLQRDEQVVNLMDRLLELFIPSRIPWYRFISFIQLKQGGLQLRLTGGRANRSFRLGKLTPLQKTLIGQTGYEIGDSR